MGTRDDDYDYLFKGKLSSIYNNIPECIISLKSNMKFARDEYFFQNQIIFTAFDVSMRMT